MQVQITIDTDEHNALLNALSRAGIALDADFRREVLERRDAAIASIEQAYKDEPHHKAWYDANDVLFACLYMVLEERVKALSDE